MSTPLVSQLVVQVIGLAAAVTLAALHVIAGADALAILGLVLGAGGASVGAHVALSASQAPTTAPGAPEGPSGRQQVA